MKEDKPYFTASQKRAMEKAKKEIRIDHLLDYIKENKPKLNKLPKDVLSIRKYNQRYGDRWFSEETWGWSLKFGDGTHYIVGNTQTIEDDENWAQAESSSSQTCHEVETHYQVKPKVILDKLKNLLS